MVRAPASTLYRDFVPIGAVLGRWRVVACAGNGVNGAVYRAVQVDKEQSSPVALKVALLPRDARFTREAELLSRLRHPSIPRLWDSGEWEHPLGTTHPFIVMDWVDGVPLYQLALQPVPAVRSPTQLVAQLASALQVIHAADAVHRDVKGGNVLVRRSDGRAMLIDFGSCALPGTEPLAPHSFLPGTPVYWPPQLHLFHLQSLQDRSARYSSRPADDLYALGVTACRLLTGHYPQMAEPHLDKRGAWHLGPGEVPPALLNDRHIDPRLRSAILRMLSTHPRDRGTAAQLAEDLAQATKPRPPRARTQLRWPWLAASAAAGMALTAAAWRLTHRQTGDAPPVARAKAAGNDKSDAGTTGLGEMAAVSATQSSDELPSQMALTEDSMPDPMPGQVRPDAKGRCPHKGQIALNGGCWMETGLDREACEVLSLSGHMGTMFRSKCYVPVLPTEHQPTSTPIHKR